MCALQVKNKITPDDAIRGNDITRVYCLKHDSAPPEPQEDILQLFSQAL